MRRPAPVLFTLWLLAVAMTLTGCTPSRGGGGGGDDDDDAGTEEPGIFVQRYLDYYGGYAFGSLLLPLETGFTCDQVDDGGFIEDSDSNYITVTLYLGIDQPSWEGSYSGWYDSDCSLSGGEYDYPDAKCFESYGLIDGNEEYGDNDDSFAIDDFSSSSVEGQLVLSDVTYDFAVSNCGDFSSAEGRSVQSGSSGHPAASPAAASSRDRPERGAWGLRFR